MLTGAERPNSGAITVGGQTLNGLTPALGHALGVGVIYQESDLVLALSVTENVFLGHEIAGRLGLLDKRAMRAAVVELIERLNLRFSPDTILRDLSPAQRQLVQIAKAVSRKIRILILDEPTATLTDNEIGYLFELLARLKAEGIGMIYVSHRLNEVMSIADRVTVMRDGQRIATLPIFEASEEKLISLMVGRKLVNAQRVSIPGGELCCRSATLPCAASLTG